MLYPTVHKTLSRRAQQSCRFSRIEASLSFLDWTPISRIVSHLVLKHWLDPSVVTHQSLLCHQLNLAYQLLYMVSICVHISPPQCITGHFTSQYRRHWRCYCRHCGVHIDGDHLRNLLHYAVSKAAGSASNSDHSACSFRNQHRLTITSGKGDLYELDDKGPPEQIKYIDESPVDAVTPPKPPSPTYEITGTLGRLTNQ